ncbi:hypothetical protein V5F53_20620 [Xanthobacter sp. V4C-4]|uniref:sulfotransferase family protein n=1 Tax=Xanthobacter cornucopiae TaxID=3119924 RepID=UPI00372B2F31
MMRKILYILGMHRSGTSALTGLLTIMGAPMPRHPMGAGTFNPKGYFESVEIMNINKRILAARGSSWSDWRALRLPERGSGAYAALRDRAAAGLREEFGDAGLIVVKDPRICRLTQVWLDAARAEGGEPLALIAYRHPLEVARSLERRNQFGLSHSLLLWLRHVVDAEHDSRPCRRAVTSMSRLLADWRAVLSDIERRLAIAWPEQVAARAAEIEAHLDRALVHHTADDGEMEADAYLKAWVSTAHGALRRLEADPDDGAAQAALDTVRDRLNAAEDLIGEILERDRQIAELRAAASAVETLTRDFVRDVEEALGTRPARVVARPPEDGAKTARLAIDIGAEAKAAAVVALDVSAFGHADCVNLILQRPEILFDRPEAAQVLPAWSSHDLGPANQVIATLGNEIPRRVAGVIGAEYRALAPLLAQLAPRRIADIGCGYAMFDLFAARDLAADLLLIDLERNEHRHFGFTAEAAAYSSLAVARRFLEDNGVPPGAIATLNPRDGGLDRAAPVDLVVSFLSCGFRYPVDRYLSFLETGLRPGGAAILDLRIKTAEAQIARLSALGPVTDLAAPRKARRILLRKPAARS